MVTITLTPEWIITIAVFAVFVCIAMVTLIKHRDLSGFIGWLAGGGIVAGLVLIIAVFLGSIIRVNIKKEAQEELYRQQQAQIISELPQPWKQLVCALETESSKSLKKKMITYCTTKLDPPALTVTQYRALVNKVCFLSDCSLAQRSILPFVDVALLFDISREKEKSNDQ